LHSGPVHEPIPAHPDALYRPQNRPKPPNNAGAARLASNPVMAAPLAGGAAAGFSPWWIAGLLLPLLVAAALAALAYAAKKKNDSKKQRDKDPDHHDNDNNIRLQSVPLQKTRPPLTTTDQQNVSPVSSHSQSRFCLCTSLYV